MTPNTTLIFISLAAGLLLMSGCQKKQPPQQDPATREKVIVKLAQMDLADGLEDKAVAKCAACALKMAGSAEHELVVYDFKLHFCSGECKKGFESDTDQKILDLQF